MTDEEKQLAATALAQYVQTNTARGRDLVVGPLREKKPIDAEQLIDLLNWARTAAGETMMVSTTDESTTSYSIERVAASAEPTIRLTAAIRKMAQLLNALVASGAISIEPGK